MKIILKIRHCNGSFWQKPCVFRFPYPFFWKVSLAQMASRMATYMEITPPSPQKRLQATRCSLEKIWYVPAQGKWMPSYLEFWIVMSWIDFNQTASKAAIAFSCPVASGPLCLPPFGSGRALAQGHQLRMHTNFLPSRWRYYADIYLFYFLFFLDCLLSKEWYFTTSAAAFHDPNNRVPCFDS